MSIYIDTDPKKGYDTDPPVSGAALSKEGKMEIPKHYINYNNMQGKSFATLEKLQEYELIKQVHKNLHAFIIEKLKILQTKEVLEFMVNNRLDLVTLLTAGNLETKTHNRKLK